MLNKQKEKKKQLQEKERRIQEREQKKYLKGTKTPRQKKNNTKVDQLVLDSESEDKIETFENICCACMGNEGLSEGENWIGCNICPRWYHRSCLSEDFEDLTENEIEDLDYVCPSCLKLNKKKK